MGKWVRIENGTVREVIPPEATTPSVAHWYGTEFAAECVEAPDEVSQGWVYDGVNFAPTATPSIADVRAQKLAEVSTACQTTIMAGVDVTTTYGVEHFSLDTYDQINISNLGRIVDSGATGFPYHADGKACVLYSAADLTAIVTAATQWVTQNTTYHNFLKTWINRETNIETLNGIFYGIELPEDLNAQLLAIMNAVSGGG